MFSDVPLLLQEIDYEREARIYLESLPLEHFMEAIPQSTQREITLESLALLKARRPDVHVFNELLVQYPRRGRRKLGQVVPDNMIVITNEPISAVGSYNVPFEAVGPFWTLEYISKSNPRKDYKISFRKYERELKVPYCLMFYPEKGKFHLYRHNKRNYVPVKPNAQGRWPIPELELEVGLLEGWVRFWHKGKLLPLPADLQRDLDEAQRKAEEAEHRAEEAEHRAEEACTQAAEEKRRADELEQRLRAAEEQLASLRSQSST